VKAGVAGFIFLRVSRLVLMFFLFLRERDACYRAISALVLAIVGAGFLAGLGAAADRPLCVTESLDRAK